MVLSTVALLEYLLVAKKDGLMAVTRVLKKDDLMADLMVVKLDAWMDMWKDESMVAHLVVMMV